MTSPRGRADEAQFQPFAWQQTIASEPANPVIRDIEALANGSWRVRAYGSEFVLDQNLAITNAKFGSYSDTLAGAATVLALADGGSITLDGREVTDRIGGALSPLNIGPDRCTVRRYNAHQQLLWRQLLATTNVADEERDTACSHIAIDAAQIWLLKAKSELRLGIDGAVSAKITLAQASSLAIATDLVASTEGGVFVSLTTNSAVTSSPSVVVSLDPLGVERWRRAATDMRRISQLLAVNDGGVIAISTAPHAPQTQLTRLDNAGQLIWERAIDATYVRAEITAGQRLRILTTETPEQAALLAFSRDGDFLWRAPSNNAPNLNARENPEPSLFLSVRNTGFVRGVIPLRSLLPAAGCASTTSLPALISNKTGLFHDPRVPGQGIMTVFNQGTLFAGWFSIDPQGAADDSAKQLWLTLQARDIVGDPNRISARIYRTLGARRDQHSSTSTLDIGEAILDFTTCDKLSVRYQFIDSQAALAMRALQGVLQLERIGTCRAQ